MLVLTPRIGETISLSGVGVLGIREFGGKEVSFDWGVGGVITVREGQAFMLGSEVVVKVLRVRDEYVRLGFDAPARVAIQYNREVVGFQYRRDGIVADVQVDDSGARVASGRGEVDPIG